MDGSTMSASHKTARAAPFLRGFTNSPWTRFAGRNPVHPAINSLLCFWSARFLAHLLCLIAGGIVRYMPLSRTQDPTADLFWAAGAQEPCRTPVHQTSAQLSAAVVSIADKSSPRYVLPRTLSNAVRQLDDLELDRLLAATWHELERRGRLTTSAPEIRSARYGTGKRASERSMATEDPSERRKPDEPKVALTQGQVNAVRANFKAGITPARIARQFGISQANVRKVLTSEFRGSSGHRRPTQAGGGSSRSYFDRGASAKIGRAHV